MWLFRHVGHHQTIRHAEGAAQAVSSSANLERLKLSTVLVGDAGVLQLRELHLFYFHQIIDVVAVGVCSPASLLQGSMLLPALLFQVGLDLVHQLFPVPVAYCALCSCLLSFFCFLLPVGPEDALKLLAFGLGLLCHLLQPGLLLRLPCPQQIVVDLPLALGRGCLLLPPLALIGLLVAPSPELVELALLVLRPLLLCAQPGDLLFLGLLEGGLPGSLTLLSRRLLHEVPGYLGVLHRLALLNVLLPPDLVGVGLGHLLHQQPGLLLLLLAGRSLLLLEPLELRVHLRPLLRHELILPDFLLPDLVDLLLQHPRAHCPFLRPRAVPLLVVLECLETLDLHHEVEPAFVLLLLDHHVFLLLNLGVADGDTLCVQLHLVHVLHRVQLLEPRHLGIAQDLGVCLHLELLCFGRRDFFFALFFHSQHLFLPL
mmetsp:Transcript_22844/g.54693  ORF Transcript_22844/g.54693 Transcript_22844/m.54693 type:complete len:428 (+) Transcript_22844:159-1442(+)